MAVDHQRGPTCYVDAVLRSYVSLPGTPERASRRDRRLARELHLRGVSLATIRTALLLATARRTFRRSPLAAVRTLHYFLPVIEEVAATPPEGDYVDYLAAKLRPLIRPGSMLLDSG